VSRSTPTRPPVADGPGPTDVAAIAQAIGLSIIAVIPGFLPGALAVSLRAEFGFGPSMLGLLISWFFFATGALSTVLGRLVERLGIPTSLMVGAVLSGSGLAGVALAPSTPWLLVAMTFGGAANAITQPAVNARLSQRIPAGHLGLAIGIKQSAIPAATLLAGLAVPTLGVWIGWRQTFTVAAVVAFGSAVLARRTTDRGGVGVVRRRLRTRDLPEVTSLVILGFAGLLGAAAATSLGAFFVDAAVDGGMAEANAGLYFALASTVGITSRVLVGWHADARPHGSPYGRIAALLAIGVPGFLLLATATPVLYVIGGLLAYGFGWAWTGLFHFAVVSQNPTAPAAATGVVQAGNSIGAGAGPLVLGWVAETSSYQAAWIGAAVLGLSAAAFTLVGRAHLRRARHRASAAYLAEIRPLTEEEAVTVADGVLAAEHVTDHLDVTLYRLAPGAGIEAPSTPRSGVVLVLSGSRYRIRIAGIDGDAQVGEHLPLPANRAWSLRNDGQEPLVVARAAAHGRISP
jgi:MFS family permease